MIWCEIFVGLVEGLGRERFFFGRLLGWLFAVRFEVGEGVFFGGEGGTNRDACLAMCCARGLSSPCHTPNGGVHFGTVFCTVFK